MCIVRAHFAQTNIVSAPSLEIYYSRLCQGSIRNNGRPPLASGSDHFSEPQKGRESEWKIIIVVDMQCGLQNKGRAGGWQTGALINVPISRARCH